MDLFENDGDTDKFCEFCYEAGKKYLLRTILTLQKYKNAKTSGFTPFVLPKVSF